VDDQTAIALISTGSALGGALIGGGVSHFTTLRSHKLQTGEDHFRHRQGVYHDFLDSAHWFMEAAKGLPKPRTNDEFGQWVLTFEHCLTGVHLFGSEEARKAAQDLADRFGDAMELTGEQKQGNIHERRAAAYGSIEDQVISLWDRTIEVMREDIGPDA